MQATHVQPLADRVLNSLSGGEKARVHLARALAQVWEPAPNRATRWLLLDEPTAALDLAHQQSVLQLARDWAHDQGVGVVAVLHDLNLALRYADDGIVLSDGTLHSTGPVRDVLTPDLVQQVWRVACETRSTREGVTQLLFV